MSSSATANIISALEQLEVTAPAEEISRPTQELVIGMVGAVGAGVTKTSTILKKMLEDEYGYRVQIIKASDIIRANANKTKIPNPAEAGTDRIKNLQAIGTELRNKFGEDYIAAKTIEQITAPPSRS